MKVLLIEDEKPAAKQLMRLLEKSESFDGIIEGPLASVEDSVAHLSEHSDYDLIFMDIHLADGPSFEIFESIQPETPIIFCTAYNQYALEAFKLRSIDYLLKPIDPNELDRALEKFNSLYAKKDQNQGLSAEVLQNLLQASQGGQNFKSRFLIRLGDKMITRQTQEIQAFYSADKASFLIDNNGRSYPVEYSLGQLESMLDPQDFFRINRQYLIRLAAIESMHNYSGSRIKIVLQNVEDSDILVSRDKTSEFKLWLDR